MCAFPSSFLRGAPRPPATALLPDGVFFSRSVPVAPGAARAEVVGQVSLVLESLSPFPLAQLYYGYYWPEGADRVLAFASYRRRFTADQVADWSGSQHVIPAFAALLGIDAAPATTAILASESGLTAVHWEKGPVPSVVIFRPLAPDAEPGERDSARSELIKACGESMRVIDLAPPVILGGGRDGEILSESGEFRSAIPAEAAAALDVRDKGDLAMLARERRRGVLLWQASIGALAACGLFIIADLGLVGAGIWQKARIAKVASQRPTVAHIMEEQELAERIGDLSTKRLLPLEMISAASPEVAMPKVPSSIQFMRATASALNTVQIEAQTTNAGEIPGYKTALEKAPGIDHVEIQGQRARDNVVSFTLIVTFKPGALTPAAS